MGGTPASAMTIRPATMADAARVKELVEHFMSQTSYGRILGLARPGVLETLIEEVIEGVGVILLAEEPEVRAGEAIISQALVVGMIALAALPHPVTGEAFVDELAWWVEPAWRGSSIGPRLLRAAEEWTVQKGLHMLKMVAPAGTDVGAFYRRSGYMEVETAWVKVL